MAETEAQLKMNPGTLLRGRIRDGAGRPPAGSCEDIQNMIRVFWQKGKREKSYDLVNIGLPVCRPAGKYVIIEKTFLQQGGPP